MLKKIIIGGILMLLPFKVMANDKPLFAAQDFYLANGMRVIVAENHRVPIVKHMVWYKIGAADEQIGSGGSAHLLEHLMFRGTKKVAGAEFNRLLDVNGVESNAFTGQDMTAYHQLADISRLELLMLLEADRMQNLQISAEAFKAEQKIVYQERKDRVDNNPIGRFYEMVQKALWQEHPYARPVSGSDTEIKNLKIEDMQNLYDEYYAPNNAVLVLAGDIDIKTAKKLAQKYYGKIKPFNKKHIDKFVELKDDYKAQIDVSDAQIKGYRLLRLFATSSYRVKAEEVYNMQVLADYMGAGKTSKLYKKLVEEKKKALSVDVSYNPTARSYGQFAIYMIPNQNITPEELDKEFMIAWQEALDELDIDELERIKQKMVAGVVYLRDNPEDAAYVLGASAIAGVKLEEVENWVTKIKSVKYQEVRKTAKQMMKHAPQVKGILRPKGENNV